MPAKMREHRAADDRVVEVRDDEVRVLQLPVDREGRQEDAGDAAEQERAEEAAREVASACVNSIVPRHSVKIQLKILTPVGIATRYVAEREEDEHDVRAAAS